MLLAALMGPAVILPAPLAHAAEADADEPEKLIKTGNELRKKGDNLRAFGYLQRAYDLSHTPRAAAQLGLCEQALGRFAEAESHLTEALASRDAWVDDKRASLQQTRDGARKHLGRVHVTGAPAQTTVVSGESPSRKLPADGMLWLPGGATTLTLEADGGLRAVKSFMVTVGEEVTVEAGLTRPVVSSTTPPPVTSTPATVGTVSPTLAPPPAATPVETSAGNSTWRTTGLIVGGLGVGLVAGGFVLRQMASSKRDAIMNDANANKPYNPANGNWETFDKGSVALFAVGGAALIGGVTLYLLNRDTAAEPETTTDPAARPVTSLRPRAWPTVSLESRGASGATAGILGIF